MCFITKVSCCAHTRAVNNKQHSVEEPLNAQIALEDASFAILFAHQSRGRIVRPLKTNG